MRNSRLIDRHDSDANKTEITRIMNDDDFLDEPSYENERDLLQEAIPEQKQRKRPTTAPRHRPDNTSKLDKDGI